MFRSRSFDVIHGETLAEAAGRVGGCLAGYGRIGEAVAAFQAIPFPPARLVEIPPPLLLPARAIPVLEAGVDLLPEVLSVGCAGCAVGRQNFRRPGRPRRLPTKRRPRRR